MFHHTTFIKPKGQEEILLIIRRHWFDILKQFFLIFLMILILIGSYSYLPPLFPGLNDNAILNGVFVFMENFFAMLIWILFFLIWIDYYFDVWVITNKRVVDVQQNGLFSREVSELQIEKIQDITTEVHGVIPTFLNYGNVYIQTAGERERFVFANVPDPYHIKDMIMKLQKQIEQEEADELSDMLKKRVDRQS